MTLKIILFILFILLTLARVNFVNSGLNGHKIRVTSQILSEPTLFDSSQLIRINNFYFYLPADNKLQYADTITVEGVLNNNKLNNPKLISVKKSNNFLFNFRKSIINNINIALPEPHAALVSGITLGSKSGLSEIFRQKLIDSGTIHVVVASGTNVTLFGGFVLSASVSAINRKKAVALTIITIWLYTLISGLEPPLVRAAIMGSIAFSAQALGRLSSALNALFISVVVMLLIFPFWLTDYGFIMSALATLSLILLQPTISKSLKFIPNLIRQDLATTISAQIGVSPILLFAFGKFNILSPLINALVLWTIVPIMIFGGIGSVVSIIYFPAGKLILLLTYPLTLWFIKTVQLFS